jgi:hypothetical protein
MLKYEFLEFPLKKLEDYGARFEIKTEKMEELMFMLCLLKT